MASSTPLQGAELIDCARANGDQDVAIAAERCGYGNDTSRFEQQLRNACEDIGIHIQGFSDLNEDNSREDTDTSGAVIAPGIDGQI
jgi:hypothetical protein